METFSILVFVVQWLVQFDLQSERSGFHSSYVEFLWSFCAHMGCLRAINCSLVCVTLSMMHSGLWPDGRCDGSHRWM